MRQAYPVLHGHCQISLAFWAACCRHLHFSSGALACWSDAAGHIVWWRPQKALWPLAQLVLGLPAKRKQTLQAIGTVKWQCFKLAIHVHAQHICAAVGVVSQHSQLLGSYLDYILYCEQPQAAFSP